MTDTSFTDGTGTIDADWLNDANRTTYGIADIASLRAITTIPGANSFVYVHDGSGTFYWDATSTAADDGVNTVKVTAIETGRYLLAYVQASAAALASAVSDAEDAVTDATAQVALAAVQVGLAEDQVALAVAAKDDAETAQGLAETAQGAAEDAQTAIEGIFTGIVKHYSGYINTSGVMDLPSGGISGFSVSHTGGTNSYTITHPLGHANFSIVATTITEGGVASATRGSLNFEVRTSLGGSSTELAFYFMIDVYG